MLEIGRLAQDLVRVFEPPGRWLFVKLIVLAFTATAVGRLMPKRIRRVVGKRPRRGYVGLRVVAAMAAVAAVTGGVLVAVRADHQLAVYDWRKLLAYENRPAHATLAAASGQYFGVYEPSAPYTYAQVRQFATATQSQPQVALYYSNWGEPFATSFADAAYSSHATTMVQILPNTVSLARIADGSTDRYLRDFAVAVRTFRRPVIIGFAPEMNGNWYDWGYQNSSPATWVAAWRRVVDVFRANGADNVIWLWTVNMIYRGSGPLKDYWPGNDYVNWVGIDAYFVPAKHAFKNVVGPTLRQVKAVTSDPIILSETGIAPGAGKVPTLRQLFAGVRADHLLGFVYFDGNQTEDAHYHYQWRLEDSPAATVEYGQLARQAYHPAPPGAASAVTSTP
jgi:hypothetical protein